MSTRLPARQRLILFAVLLLSANDPFVMVSGRKLRDALGSWNGIRQRSLYDLIDNGYLIELHRWGDNSTYYSPTEAALEFITCSRVRYSPDTCYSDDVF